MDDICSFSARELQPQYDALLQGMSFPHLENVYCLRLRKNVHDPHLKEIRPVGASPTLNPLPSAMQISTTI